MRGSPGFDPIAAVQSVRAKGCHAWGEDIMTTRSIHRLNALMVERTRRSGKYPDGGGLYMQVVGASRAWHFRHRWLGTERYMGLGPTCLVSLGEARELARSARKLLHDGIDPLAARQAERVRLLGFFRPGRLSCKAGPSPGRRVSRWISRSSCPRCRCLGTVANRERLPRPSLSAPCACRMWAALPG